MACANAVGSNVFNIFLGIGLPMILSEITWKEPYVVPDGLPVLVSFIMLIAITILMVRSATPQPACRPRLTVVGFLRSTSASGPSTGS